MNAPTIKRERGPLLVGGKELPADLNPTVGLTESTIRGRVLMLHRMKRNLICDWHPILDILLGDYEQELKRVEALREPPDPSAVAFDVQDRDFDDEAKES